MQRSLTYNEGECIAVNTQVTLAIKMTLTIRVRMGVPSRGVEAQGYAPSRHVSAIAFFRSHFCEALFHRLIGDFNARDVCSPAGQ